MILFFKTVLAYFAWIVIGVVSIFVSSIVRETNYECAERWGKAYHKFVTVINHNI